MIKRSSDTATSIDAHFANGAEGNEGDFIVWASTMQHDAAHITGPGELAEWAGVLAKDSGDIYRLFGEAKSDRSPDVEESPWMTQYNEISRDVNIALDVFRINCPGMELG